MFCLSVLGCIVLGKFQVGLEGAMVDISGPSQNVPRSSYSVTLLSQ